MAEYQGMRVPGTVQLIDEDGTVRSKAVQKNDTADIILVPAPSTDPEDPLNWTFRRKMLSTSCILIYTLMVVLPSTTVYSVTIPIATQTSLTLDNLITGLGVMFLFAGWGCIPLQALALQYGKRPIYLSTMAGLIGVMVWAPHCKSWPPYLANKILHGILSAPVESLCEISITDIWFTHERPRYLAAYGFALAFAGKLAPALSGFINYGMNWQWVLYWSAIWVAIAFVYCFFLMEETTYDRAAPQHITTPDSGAVVDATNGSTHSAKKGLAAVDNDQPRSDIENGSMICAPKPYWQKLSVWPQTRPNRLFQVMWGQLYWFSYPVVVYAGLMYGANGLTWSSILNATASTIYAGTYGFSTAGIASAYLAGCLGVIIGALYCGKLGEMLVIRLARHNNGVAEPEHILWTFMASLIFVPFSLLLWGLGDAYKIHWFGMVFAQVTLSISNAIVCPMALAYAINSYPELSSELVTTTVIIRNTMTFAINYGINPWIKHEGRRNTFITASSIGFVWNASMFFMMRYGRRLREMSARRYWAAVDRARASGMSH